MLNGVDEGMECAGGGGTTSRDEVACLEIDSVITRAKVEGLFGTRPMASLNARGHRKIRFVAPG